MTDSDPIGELLGDKLVAALDDPEIQHTLFVVKSTSGLDKTALHAEVEGRFAQIRTAVAVQESAFHAAEDSLATSRRVLDSRLLYRHFSALGIASGLLALSVVAVASLLAILHDNSELLWLALLGIYAIMPWQLVEVLRTRDAHRLGIAARDKRRESALQRLEIAVRDQVTVTVREVVNEHLVSFMTTFRIFDRRGLRQLADPEREVSTAATEQLKTLMESLEGGSIGLSGPRGAGKTTLIQRLARGRTLLSLGEDREMRNRERLGLVVSAPVRYDAREFVLHLFAQLCEQVLGPERVEHIENANRPTLRSQRRGVVGRFLVAAGAVLGVVGCLMLVYKETAPQGANETGTLLLLIAGLSAYVGILLLLNATQFGRSDAKGPSRLSRQLGRASDEITNAVRAQAAAERRLEEIRYQQSVSAKWSASAQFPVGMTLGGESSLTLSRAPWSLPEVVDVFLRFARSLTQDHYLVVGIDELDKMDATDARQFLNDVKGLFGAHGCYFLVSVSEDAMSSFERRGLPFRDVFDSSFDAIQRVGYLTLAESRGVLESRVTGLPVPYQCFCYCLAGGLSRDLIRVTRELVNQQRERGSNLLGDLCHAVVQAEMRGKVAAALVSIRAVEGDRAARDQVLEWIATYDGAGLSPEELHQRVSDLSTKSNSIFATAEETEAWGPYELAIELAAYGYYAATLLEFFTDDERLSNFLKDPHNPLQLSAKSVGALEALARSRQHFTISPWLSWDDISCFRAGTWLESWSDLNARRAPV